MSGVSKYLLQCYIGIGTRATREPKGFTMLQKVQPPRRFRPPKLVVRTFFRATCFWFVWLQLKPDGLYLAEPGGGIENQAEKIEVGRERLVARKWYRCALDARRCRQSFHIPSTGWDDPEIPLHATSILHIVLFFHLMEIPGKGQLLQNENCIVREAGLIWAEVYTPPKSARLPCELIGSSKAGFVRE